MAVVTLSLQAKLNVFETACMQTRLMVNTIQYEKMTHQPRSCAKLLFTVITATAF